MEFLIEWMIPQRLLHCRIEGDISTTDAQSIAEQLEHHIQAGITPVHVIMDMSDMGSFPGSVSQLNRMSRWVYHERTGWIISISPNKFMSFVGALVTGMAGVKYRSVTSLAEAQTVLHKVDISLPVR